MSCPDKNKSNLEKSPASKGVSFDHSSDSKDCSGGEGAPDVTNVEGPLSEQERTDVISRSSIPILIGKGIVEGFSFTTDESCHINLTPGTAVTSDGQLLIQHDAKQFRYYNLFLNPNANDGSSLEDGASEFARKYFLEGGAKGQSLLTKSHVIFRLYENPTDAAGLRGLKENTSIVDDSNEEVLDASFFAEQSTIGDQNIQDLDHWVLALFFDTSTKEIIPLLINHQDAFQMIQQSGALAKSNLFVEQEDEPIGLPALFSGKERLSQGEAFNFYNRGKALNKVSVRRFGYGSFEKLPLEDTLFPQLPASEDIIDPKSQIPYLRIFQEYQRIVDYALIDLRDGLESLHESYRDQLGVDRINTVDAYLKLFFRRYADYKERTKAEIKPIDKVFLGPDNHFVILRLDGNINFDHGFPGVLQNAILNFSRSVSRIQDLYIGPKKELFIIGETEQGQQLIHYNIRLPKKLRMLLDIFKTFQSTTIKQLVLWPDRSWMLITEGSFGEIINAFGDSIVKGIPLKNLVESTGIVIDRIILEESGEVCGMAVYCKEGNSRVVKIGRVISSFGQTVFSNPAREYVKSFYMKQLEVLYRDLSTQFESVVLGLGGQASILYRGESDELKLHSFPVDDQNKTTEIPKIVKSRLNHLFDQNKNIRQVAIGTSAKYVILADDITGFWYSGNISSELKEDLFRLTGNGPISIQYLYAFVKNLTDTFNELLSELSKLELENIDQAGFSNHVFLGKVQEKVSFEKSIFRQYFKQPPIYNDDADDLNRVRFLHWRLVALINAFSIPDANYDKNTEIDNPFYQSFRDVLRERVEVFPKTHEFIDLKITPSAALTRPLGQQAIPFYYPLSNSEISPHRNWDYESHKTNQEDHILSYHASFRESSYTQLPQVVHPFAYQIEDFDFYRIEGVLGKYLYPTAAENGVQKIGVLPQLLSMRNRYNLSFDILKIPLSKFIELYNYLLYRKKDHTGFEPQFLDQRLASPEYVQLFEKRGMEHLGGVKRGGSFVLVYDDQSGGENRIVADFCLPYFCCNNDAQQSPIDDPPLLRLIEIKVLDSLAMSHPDYEIPVLDANNPINEDFVLKFGNQELVFREGPYKFSVFPGSYHLGVVSDVYRLVQPHILEVGDPQFEDGDAESVQEVVVYVQREYALMFLILGSDALDEFVTIENIVVRVKDDPTQKSLVDEVFMYEILSLQVQRVASDPSVAERSTAISRSLPEPNITLQKLYGLTDEKIASAIPLKVPIGRKELIVELNNGAIEPFEFTINANPSSITEYLILIDDSLDTFSVVKNKEVQIKNNPEIENLEGKEGSNIVVPSPTYSLAKLFEHLYGQDGEMSAEELKKDDDFTKIKGISRKDKEQLNQLDIFGNRGIRSYEALSKVTPEFFKILELKLKKPLGTIAAEKWISQAEALHIITNIEPDPYNRSSDLADDLTLIQGVNPNLLWKLNNINENEPAKNFWFHGQIARIKPEHYPILESKLDLPAEYIKSKNWREETEGLLFDKLFSTIGEGLPTSSDYLELDALNPVPDSSASLNIVFNNDQTLLNVFNGIKDYTHPRTKIKKSVRANTLNQLMRLSTVSSDHEILETLIWREDTTQPFPTGQIVKKKIRELAEEELKKRVIQVIGTAAGSSTDLANVQGFDLEQSVLNKLRNGLVSEGIAITTLSQFSRLNKENLDFLEWKLGLTAGTLSPQLVLKAKSLLNEELFDIIQSGTSTSTDSLRSIQGITPDVELALKTKWELEGETINTFLQIWRMVPKVHPIVVGRLGLPADYIRTNNWQKEAEKLLFEQLFERLNGGMDIDFKDDLKNIQGIDRDIETILNHLQGDSKGIKAFIQLFNLTNPTDISFVDELIQKGLKEKRIEREYDINNWPALAREEMRKALKVSLGQPKAIPDQLEQIDSNIKGRLRAELINLEVNSFEQFSQMKAKDALAISALSGLKLEQFAFDQWKKSAEIILNSSTLLERMGLPKEEKDDLTQVSFISPQMEEALNGIDVGNGISINSFEQIIALSSEDQLLIENLLNLEEDSGAKLVRETRAFLAAKLNQSLGGFKALDPQIPDDLTLLDIDPDDVAKLDQFFGINTYLALSQLKPDDHFIIEDALDFDKGSLVGKMWAKKAESVIFDFLFKRVSDQNIRNDSFSIIGVKDNKMEAALKQMDTEKSRGFNSFDQLALIPVALGDFFKIKIPGIEIKDLELWKHNAGLILQMLDDIGHEADNPDPFTGILEIEPNEALQLNQLRINSYRQLASLEGKNEWIQFIETLLDLDDDEIKRRMWIEDAKEALNG